MSEALALLRQAGIDGMTMRALGTRAGINPMTIYHHFKDRDGLIKAIADSVYSEVATPKTGDALARVRGLLMLYRAKVDFYPSLTLAIFARSALFPDQARRITGELSSLLVEFGLSSQRSLLWAYILVDYTHGAALATAQSAVAEGQGANKSELSTFENGLIELLAALERASLG